MLQYNQGLRLPFPEMKSNTKVIIPFLDKSKAMFASESLFRTTRHFVIESGVA